MKQTTLVFKIFDMKSLNDPRKLLASLLKLSHRVGGLEIKNNMLIQNNADLIHENSVLKSKISDINNIVHD